MVKGINKRLLLSTVCLSLILISTVVIHRRLRINNNHNSAKEYVQTIDTLPQSIPKTTTNLLYKPKSITTIKESGGRVDWSRSGNNSIAYDRVGSDGFYDVFTMQPDGSNDICITCTNQGLPGKHMGNPAWNPSGTYLVFQAQRQKYFDNISSLPGFGAANDLWAITPDGKNTFRLTDEENGNNKGVLHPHFSYDGKKLSWSQLYKPFSGPLLMGYWKIRVGDFIVDERGPRIENIKDFIPGPETIYENHGFLPDDKEILFSTFADIANNAYSITNIYKMDLNTKKVIRITDNTGIHNEHASFSPNGEKIAWMTGKDNQNGGTEYWIMNPDGSDKQRLTHFNEQGYPEYDSQKLIAADLSWDIDGTKIVGYVQNDLKEQTGKIVLIELE